MIHKTFETSRIIYKKFKRLCLLSITFMMTFLLTACTQVLNEYKETAKINLDNYVEEKGISNYYSDNWQEITFAVTHGKKAINAAKTKSAVDIAVETAINSIDQVYVREFYPDDEHRLHILDLYHSWALSEYGYVPSSEAEHFIYYGQYNDFYVLKFTGWYFSCYTEFIDELDFSRPGVGEIYAISEDVGGTLKEIYEVGYITRSELEEIHRIHNAIYHRYFEIKNVPEGNK